MHGYNIVAVNCNSVNAGVILALEAVDAYVLCRDRYFHVGRRTACAVPKLLDVDKISLVDAQTLKVYGFVKRISLVEVEHDVIESPWSIEYNRVVGRNIVGGV